MKLFIKSLIPTILISALLSACGGSSNDDFDKVHDHIPNYGPIFDFEKKIFPKTNDLFFAGHTDGTLNIPNVPENPLITAINQLDGFSTSNPILAEFGMELDPASLLIGKTIHVFEINAAGTTIAKEVPATEMVAKPVNGKTLMLFPRLPLKGATKYLVVLTKNIKATDGNYAGMPSTYSLLRSNAELTGDYVALKPLRPLIQYTDRLAKTHVNDSDIILTWSFTTQSTAAVLDFVAANAVAGTIVTAPTGANTSAFQPTGINYDGRAFTGKADVHIGTLEIPYYLEKPSLANPTAPLNGTWKGVNGSFLTRYNPNPVQNSALKIPLMMTIPNATSGQVKPATGWPVVIYQHGITRVRTDMLIYADEMAKAGFAVIAIDLPLHGITDNTNPFHASKTAFVDDVEPTFDVDFINNTTSAPGPDGNIDSSGAHYINLSSLLTSRDNTRQGVSNLLVLRRSLKDIANIDESKVGFIAHSLGGIVGVPYLAVEDNVMPSSLITTGASISTILNESQGYGPIIRGGLAAQGITGAKYQAFLLGAQWILDSSDPINFAQDAAEAHPIHLTEIVGDGGTHVPDTTVPNSSTEILVALMGAQAASATTNTVAKGLGKSKIVRFTQGDHSSVLDPTDDAPTGTTYINVFKEIHSQLSSFQKSGGASFNISDKTIIVPAP